MTPRPVTSGNIGISKIYLIVNLLHSPMIRASRFDVHITVLADCSKIKLKNFEKKIKRKKKKLELLEQF